MDHERRSRNGNAAKVRERLLTSSTFTLAALADLRGERLEHTRIWLDRACTHEELFFVVDNGDVVVPGVLLTRAGDPRAELRPLLHELLRAGSPPWMTWVWLTSPTSLLSGGVPEQLASTTPDRALRAATRFAARMTRKGAH